jgi:hypothetical protein
MAMSTCKIMVCPRLEAMMRCLVQYTPNFSDFNGVESAVYFNHTGLLFYTDGSDYKGKKLYIDCTEMRGDKLAEWLNLQSSFANYSVV